MEITKTKQENGKYVITIKKDNQEFKIFYGDNGDLYWSIINHERPTSDEEFFVIDKEDYGLFASFQQLYSRIEDCKIYDVDPLELELCETPEEEAELYEQCRHLNESAADSVAYDAICSPGGITFTSDDTHPMRKSNTVSIVESYDRESFILQFNSATSGNDSLDIRFRAEGSRFRDFTTVFFRQYNELCAEDFNYHQIHIEELLYQKRLTKQPQTGKSE